MLARSKTQTEIAHELGCDQSTVSDDIRALKEMSQRFIFDLAKSDLSFYYKQKLDSLDEVKRECWRIYNADSTTTREKLLALKVIISSDETAFKLLNEGPAILAVRNLEERLSRVEAV